MCDVPSIDVFCSESIIIIIIIIIIIFSTTVVEIFFILRRNKLEVIKGIYSSSCKVPVIPVIF